MIVYKLATKLSTQILPLLFWIFLLFGFDKVFIAVMTLLCALLHEMGHYIAVLCQKCDTGTPIGRFSGFKIQQKGISSYYQNILIFLGGPLINIGVSALFLPLAFKSRYILYFCFINFATAISNLLPIKGHDGYNAIRELFRMRCIDVGIIILDNVSFFLSVVLTFLSLYMMYYRNEGYWIFGIFLFTVLSEIKERLKTAL